VTILGFRNTSHRKNIEPVRSFKKSALKALKSV